MKKTVSLILVLVVTAAALSVSASAWWKPEDSAVNTMTAMIDEGEIPAPDNAAYYDRFVAQYSPIRHYRELYTHLDANGSPDWVVVEASYECCSPIEYSYMLNDRIVNVGDYLYPFSGGYGVYDVGADHFTALNDSALEQYDGLREYTETMRLGRPFGDVDKDSEITVIDATFIQRSLSGIKAIDDNIVVISTKTYERSDFNLNGETEITDATFIQRYLANMCDIHCQPVARLEENTDALVVEFDFNTDRPSADGYTDSVTYTSDPLPKYSNTDIPQLHKDHKFGVALVRSTEQLKAETGLVRDTYSDSFFENNALVIAWGQFNYHECYAHVDGIYRDGKTLAVNYHYGYDFRYDEQGHPMGSPSTPCMCVLCPVARDDVKYVDNIIAVR